MQTKTYVLQVLTGREEEMKTRIARLASLAEGEEAYVPRSVLRKKVRGEWIEEKKILFPGYVFVNASDIDRIAQNLFKVPGLTKILKTGEDFTPLTSKEEQTLMKLQGKDHLMEYSNAFKDGDKIVITHGPMKDFSGQITYINRHKHFAIVEVEMFNQKIEVRMGIDLMNKE